MTILYSSKEAIIKYWKSALGTEEIRVCHNERTLFSLFKKDDKDVILFVETRQYEDIESFLSLLQADYPLLKTLVFSHHPSYAQGYPLLHFGIKAYGNTHMAPIHLLEALNAVKMGHTWLYPEFIQMMIQELSKQKEPLIAENQLLQKLSEREREIALLVKQGLSNKEIAQYTSITERTVKAHLSAIFDKTGLKDRLSLALHL